MARTVYCKKLDRDAEGLDAPPLRGAIGQEIFENVSREAWAEWEEMQLKIVNEYHLDLADKEARKTLREQMRAFLNLDEDAAEVMAVGTPTEQEPG